MKKKSKALHSMRMVDERLAELYVMGYEEFMSMQLMEALHELERVRPPGQKGRLMVGVIWYPEE